MVSQRIFRHGPFNRPIQISAKILSAYRQRCRHLSDDSLGTDHFKMAVPSQNKIWAQLHPTVAIQDTPSTVLVLHPPIKTSIIARLLKDYRTFVFASTGRLFSLARFRTTHEAYGAAQYLRRQDKVLGLSVAFMAEPALSRFIRFRFRIHSRIGGIVDVIERHATQAEGYAIQSFLDAQEVGVVLGFPSEDLASEARKALLSTLDPLLATDARFNSTFLDAYPNSLHVHIGPPMYHTLISQIQDSRIVNGDTNGFGKSRPQTQPLEESENMDPSTNVAITGSGLNLGYTKRIFTRFPGYYTQFPYREFYVGRFRTIYAAELAFASLRRNPPVDNFSVRYLVGNPCASVTIRFDMLGPVEAIGQIIEEHTQEAFKFYIRQSLSFIIVQLAFHSTEAATRSLRALQKAPSIPLAHSAKFSASYGHAENAQGMSDWTIGVLTSRTICSDTEMFFQRRLESQLKKQEAIARAQRVADAASAQQTEMLKEDEDPKMKLTRLVDPSTPEPIVDTKESGRIVRDPPPTPLTPRSDFRPLAEVPAPPPQVSPPVLPEDSTLGPSFNDTQHPTLSSASLRKWMLPLPTPTPNRVAKPISIPDTFVLPEPSQLKDRHRPRPHAALDPDPETFMLPETPRSQGRLSLTWPKSANPAKRPSPVPSPSELQVLSGSPQITTYRLRQERRRTGSSRGPKLVDPATSHPSFRRSRPKSVNASDAGTNDHAGISASTEDGVRRGELLPWDTGIPPQKF